MVQLNLTPIRLAIILGGISTVAMQKNDSSSVSVHGCSPENKFLTTTCACLLYPELSVHLLCPKTDPTELQKNCGALRNSSYILQQRETGDELSVLVNFNTTFDIEVVVVTANCSIDCSGANHSICPLSIHTFNYSVNSEPVQLRDIYAENYCLRMQLPDYHACVIHTKLYTANPPGEPHPKNTLYLGENRVFLLILIVCFMTASACTTTYICKRGSKISFLRRGGDITV